MLQSVRDNMKGTIVASIVILFFVVPMVLTGVGGGIFLSPLLIMLRWEEVKKVSGVAAAFILVNSIAGLFGFLSSNVPRLPDGIWVWAAAAIVGGYIGAEYGSKRFGNSTIKLLLSLVLLIAGIKMFATA